MGFGLDLTRRELQGKLKKRAAVGSGPKADGAAVFSPIRAAAPDIGSLALRLEINGQPRQAGGST